MGFFGEVSKTDLSCSFSLWPKAKKGPAKQAQSKTTLAKKEKQMHFIDYLMIQPSVQSFSMGLNAPT
jgi:hypothetical protein